MIGKILLHIGKNLSEARRQRTSVVRSKNSWGFGIVTAVPQLYPHLSLETVFSAQTATKQNCYINMNIGYPMWLLSESSFFRRVLTWII